MRFSVIITNWNYGHFLSECVDSVLMQTRPADEIILVDDGSTDSSEAVLAACESRLRVIRQANAGQASAMERGFRESTGEVVLFLDADDLLKPIALEAIEHCWHPDFAAVCFGLDLTGRDGRIEGSYDVWPVTGDVLPLLLSDGVFPFMPTSGNAFNRRALERIFPIPAERWRICSDAILVRGAALWGEIRPIPASLGCYRMHSANNYFREVAPTLWANRRGLRDMAEAARHFAAAMSRDQFAGPKQTLSRQLRVSEVKLRMSAVEHHDRRAGVAPALAEALSAELGGGEARHRFRYAAGFAALLLLWRVRRVRRSLVYRTSRPYWLDRLIQGFLGSSSEARRRAMRPRFQPESPFYGELVGTTTGDQILSRLDWRNEAGAAWLCGHEGAICLKLKHSTRPIRIAFRLEATDTWRNVPVEAAIMEADDVVASTWIDGSGVLEHIIPAERTQSTEPVELRLLVSPQRSRRNLLRAASVVKLTSLTAAPVEFECSGVVLPAGEPVAFAAVAAGCVAEGRIRQGRHGAMIDGGLAVLRFRLDVGAFPSMFVFRFAEDQAKGWLLVRYADRIVFDGQIGPGAEAALQCPASAGDSGLADFTISFAPEDEFDDPRIALDWLCRLAAARSFADEADGPGKDRRPPVLSAGQQVLPIKDDLSERIFSHGWSLDEHDGAVLRDTSGMIEFILAPQLRGEARVLIDLVPLTGFEAPESDFIVTVGVRGGQATRVNLQGRHTLEIPLSRSDGVTANAVALTLHAVRLDPAGTAVPRPRGLAVARLAIAGFAVRPKRPMRDDTPARGSFHHEIADLAMLAREAAETAFAPKALEDFRRRRAALVEAFRRLAVRAVAPTLAHPGVLAGLAAIGRCFRSFADADCGDHDGDARWTGAEANRNFAIDLLSRPAWRCRAAETVEAIPPLPAAFPEAVAGWLTETPHGFAGEAELAAYCGYLASLCRGCRNLLQREYAGSRYFALAEETFRRIQPNRLLFTSLNLRPLAVAEGEARQTLLQLSGSAPAYAPPAQLPEARINLAVLAKGLSPGPEGWLLFGMFGGLDKTLFRTTLYVLENTRPVRDPDRVFDTVISLEDLAIDHAVATIRAAGHDLLMLAGYPGGQGPLAEIAAHRLAPVQVATSAVCPRTTGLRCFDIMLSSRLTEPPNAAEHYRETLHLWDEPVQCFDFGGDRPVAVRTPALARRAVFGLPRDATLLVSGAMTQKIGPDLAAAWVAILQQCPDAVLVLYPYAKNWRQSYPKERFRMEWTRILESRGISPERLVILEDMSISEVRDLLAASDLYLDSFPYAGATTVVEALLSGLPVVTLAGVTQRGLQGSAWLKAYGIDEGIAHTIADYIATAVRLTQGGGARRAVRRRLLSALSERSGLMDPDQFGKRLGAWLSDISGRECGEIISCVPTDRHRDGRTP